MFEDDTIIGLADRFLEQSKTYREALLLVQAVENEIRLRALEQEV